MIKGAIYPNRVGCIAPNFSSLRLEKKSVYNSLINSKLFP